MTNKPKVVVIVGPTASGKTALAIHLAKKFNGEIISADSRQVYSGMDIGTAKPKLARRGKFLYSQNIRHHLMNIRKISQPFSAADFKNRAEKAVRDIAARGKLPIVVGGTGLYVKTLVESLNLAATPADLRLRRKFTRELKTDGLAHLFSKLIKLDPEAAYIIDPKNPRRVIRALEIALAGKKPLTKARTRRRPLFNFLELGIDVPREELKKKIEVRVRAMITGGLVDEVRELLRSHGKNSEPLSAIGYREVIDYLGGKISLDRAIRQIQTNTWRYAKKQIAWFKKDPRVRWIKTKPEAEGLVSAFIRLPF